VQGWGRKKSRFYDEYLASSHVVNAATAKCYTHNCAGPWQVGDTHRWLAASFVVRGRRTTKCL